MFTDWGLVIDAAILSLYLGVATYLKRTLRIFDKFLIPNSIIAGFLGLLFGSEVLKLIKLDPDNLGVMIYHLLAIGFIALTLKERSRVKSADNTRTGIIIVATYIFQGILGFGITLILAYTVYPDLFPGFGLLLPLGYGQGPGNAYNIGSQWEALGFKSGGNIGLSIAAFGFLWACFGGVTLMNYLVKKYKIKVDSQETISEKITEEDSPDDIPLSESIDRISVQLFLIGIIYLLTYLTLKGLDYVLSGLGSFGETLATLFWGFNFLFGVMYAMLFRFIFDYLKKKKILTRNYPNNFLLQRIAGGSFDFLVAAGVSAISIKIFVEYLVPTLLVTVLGGILTAVFLIVLCKKYFKGHYVESILALYGNLTGTIPNGLALLREIDPNFKSQVATHLVLGSGIALMFGFPLMVILNIPVIGFKENRPELFLITLAIFSAYLAALLLILHRLRKKK